MIRDAFSQCHPAVNFLYLLGAICFGVIIQHPAYVLAGIAGSAAYYLLLKRAKGLKFVAVVLPICVFIALINPVFNLQGATVLFYLLERPYSLEALYYGMAMGGIFLIMMLWFGCYSAVLTSDKFTSLFGGVIPALSLLLVMVLRLIPSLARKAKQIVGARTAIGKGLSEGASRRDKVSNGMVVISALVDWALEGSISTADSMRARGYGAGKRTTFQLYRMTMQDWVLLAVAAVFAALTVLGADLTTQYVPTVEFASLGFSFCAYCAYLLIPTVLHIKEAVTWRILRSRI